MLFLLLKVEQKILGQLWEISYSCLTNSEPCAEYCWLNYYSTRVHFRMCRLYFANRLALKALECCLGHIQQVTFMLNGVKVPSVKLHPHDSRILSRTSLCLALFILPTILIILLVLAFVKHLHSMMLLTLCVTIETHQQSLVFTRHSDWRCTQERCPEYQFFGYRALILLFGVFPELRSWVGSGV